MLQHLSLMRLMKQLKDKRTNTPPKQDKKPEPKKK